MIAFHETVGGRMRASMDVNRLDQKILELSRQPATHWRGFDD
jgi:hypothetical protein